MCTKVLTEDLIWDTSYYYCIPTMYDDAFDFREMYYALEFTSDLLQSSINATHF